VVEEGGEGMKEHPILFTGDMVRAILDGRKTQTRRVIKPQPRLDMEYIDNKWWRDRGTPASEHTKCPYGQPGDRDWIRKPIVEDGWYIIRGLLGDGMGGDNRPVFVNVVPDEPQDDSSSHGSGLVWGFDENDDPESVGLDTGITQANVEWKRPGDRLWVKETFCYGKISVGELSDGRESEPYISQCKDDNDIIYKQTIPQFFDMEEVRWKPSIFMPRWASRITLEVTDVRVERVQEMTDSDAGAEGMPDCKPVIPIADCTICEAKMEGDCLTKRGFKGLWDSINAKRGFGWSVNPWVWVVTFKLLDKKG
jgi:hypothetical protein